MLLKRTWTCAKFVEKSVSKRWDTAKHFNICFRCLGDGHRGKSCPRNLPCGKNGCKKLHHVLSHRNDDRQVKANSKCYILDKSFPTKTCHNPAESTRIVTKNLHVHQGTEGNDKTKELQMQKQNDFSADFRRLPTGSVVMTQGDRKCKVGNATVKQCTNRRMAENGFAPPLGNFADISCFVEN